ncbi:MAG: 4Fe-4S dicluster domain-containing protein [Ignavibacteriales bacterium]
MNAQRIRKTIPRVHVQVTQPDDCLDCHLCNRVCPMTLNVQAMVRQGRTSNPECITCGACAAACRKGLLRFGYARDSDRVRNGHKA